MPASIPISLRIGPLTREIVAEPSCHLFRRAIADRSRPSPGSPANTQAARRPSPELTATFSTVNSQNSRKHVGRIRPTTLSGGRLVPFSIFATRSSVGSVTGRKSVQRVLDEQRLEIVLGVGGESARRGPVETNAFEIFVRKRTGQPFDQFLHERQLGDRISPLDVRAQLRGRSIDYGLRDEGLPRARHAVGKRAGAGEPGEGMGVNYRRLARRFLPAPLSTRRPSGYRCFKARYPISPRRRRQRFWRACRDRPPNFRAA